MRVKIINKSIYKIGEDFEDRNELPKYATPGSVGMDIRAYIVDTELNPTHRIIHPKYRMLIHTGIYMELSPGYECQVRPRSGLAYKQGITVLNSPGTIDSDYRGELGVILYNAGNDSVTIENGERIAQLVFNKVEIAETCLVEEIEDSERSSGGFGHTGK